MPVCASIIHAFWDSRSDPYPFGPFMVKRKVLWSASPRFQNLEFGLSEAIGSLPIQLGRRDEVLPRCPLRFAAANVGFHIPEF